MNSLIAGMSECIGNLYAFPRNYRLRLFPTKVTDRRCCVRNSTINSYAFDVCRNTLYETALDREDRTFLLCTRSKKQRKCKIK